MKKKKNELTPLQLYVTRENGTEPAFDNAYWNNKEEGIYVDIISGEVLFSSIDKFDLGCGWPSFTKPFFDAKIIYNKDNSHGMQRTEVRTEKSDAHLGHVFNDGPGPDFKRYCINSAALRFIAKKDLEKEGYGEYKKIFENKALETAAFGAGCFWGVEALFKKIPGIIETQVGYMGGKLESPSYEEVCTGLTGHAEVVKVTYNPNLIDYKSLLDLFWRMHDPTTPNQQGPNFGTQYRSVIFYYSTEQKKAAEDSKSKLENNKEYPYPIITAIVPAEKFYAAEPYHQNYYDKHPGPICHVLKPL